MGNRSARRRAVVTLAVAMAAAIVVVVPVQDTRPASAAGATKYPVCHRTNAIKNPYRRISVSWAALGTSGNGHGGHDPDSVFDVADPVGTHGTLPRDMTPGGGNDRWGDVFSHTKGSTRQKNWTAAGQAIFAGATFSLDGVVRQACRSMKTMEFIESEADAGVLTLAEIMQELDEQKASEDLLLREQLGTSFSNWYASIGSPDLAGLKAALPDSPTASMDPVTPLSCTSVRLDGAVDPKGLQTVVAFELSSDAAFAAATEIATGSTTTTPSAVTADVGSLVEGGTYYARVAGTVTSGTGDAAVSDTFYSNAETFTMGSCSTTTTTTEASTTTTTTTEASTTTTTAAPTTTTTTAAPTTTTTTAAPTTTTAAPITTSPGSATTAPTTVPPSTTSTSLLAPVPPAIASPSTTAAPGTPPGETTGTTTAGPPTADAVLASASGRTTDDRVSIVVPLEPTGTVGDGPFRVACTSLAPNSPVQLTLHPAHVVLARGTTSDRGDCELIGSLPAQISAGEHVLTLAGVAPDGMEVLGSVTIRVAETAPVVATALPRTGTGAAGLALPAASVLGIGLACIALARRIRRRPAG